MSAVSTINEKLYSDNLPVPRRGEQGGDGDGVNSRRLRLGRSSIKKQQQSGLRHVFQGVIESASKTKTIAIQRGNSFSLLHQHKLMLIGCTKATEPPC